MLKKNYKKILSLLLIVIFFAPALVKAGNLSNAFSSGGFLEEAAGSSGAGYNTENPDTKLTSMISLVIQSVLSLLGVIFLVLVVYGGFTWMTARGNEQEAEKAKDIITRSIIGLVIVLAAYGISVFVVRFFSSTTLTGT